MNLTIYPYPGLERTTGPVRGYGCDLVLIDDGPLPVDPADLEALTAYLVAHPGNTIYRGGAIPGAAWRGVTPTRWLELEARP